MTLQNITKYIVSAMVVICSALLCSAVAAPPRQVALENLSRMPLDTIATNDSTVSVVLYSNNTWEYHQQEAENKTEGNIFAHNWETTELFAYRNIKLNDLDEVTELKLVDDLDDFAVPMKGKLYSKYGPRSRYRSHNGVDIPIKVGEPVDATFEGKVRYAQWNTGGYGYMVIIRHLNGLETYYAHLCRLNVKVNDYVQAGQVIGFGGNTGRSSGPHLHFEIRYKDQAFDPEHIIDFENGTLRYTTFALDKKFFSIYSRASKVLEEEELEGTSELLASAEKYTPSPKTSNEVTLNQDVVYHTIKRGDILGRIASRYGVSMSSICSLNGIKTNTVLKIGRKLRIK